MFDTFVWNSLLNPSHSYHVFITNWCSTLLEQNDYSNAKIANTGCNIGSKAVFAKPLKFTWTSGTSTCPAALSNKGELHCEHSGQNLTCQTRQVRVVFSLPDCSFLPNSLATGQPVMLHAAIAIFLHLFYERVHFVLHSCYKQ